ncbi:Retaining alpha-galactosidase, partial [termite gut metagenome]
MVLAIASVQESYTQSRESYSVKSPDGKIALTVNTGKDINWQVNYENDQVILPSTISLTLAGDEVLGINPKVSKATQASVNNTFNTPFYKKGTVVDKYNQLVLTFKGDYSLEFRAYNDGVAYRFLTARKKDLTIKNEEATFNFNGDYKAFVPYINDMRAGERYTFSFESFYDEVKLSEMKPD